MKIKNHIIISQLVVVFIVAIMVMSCTKKPVPIDPTPVSTLGKGFYVINQGNFTSGNSSLSYFRYDSSKMINNIFYRINGIPLGDVGHSMAFWKTFAFVVVNNSGTIWAINSGTGAIMGKLSGLQSPRYVCVIDDNKSYVSDLNIPGITVFKTSTMANLGTIQTGKRVENMLLYKNKVFAANWTQYNQTKPNNSIQVIDAAFDRLSDSIVLVKEPNSMVIDKNNKLWVLCSGGYLNEEIPALFKINPENLTIEKRYNFPNKQMSPDQLSINPSRDTLFFLNQDIFRMSIDAQSIPSQPFINRGNRNFFALAIAPGTSQIVVTDAGNWVQNGYVYRFNPNGMLVDSLKVGIIPGFIGFNN